jgi:hypothetical protein
VPLNFLPKVKTTIAKVTVGHIVAPLLGEVADEVGEGQVFPQLSTKEE